jgi:hypothetical protein
MESLQSNLSAIRRRSWVFISLSLISLLPPLHCPRKLVVTWTQIHRQIYLSWKCNSQTTLQAKDENINGAAAWILTYGGLFQLVRKCRNKQLENIALCDVCKSVCIEGLQLSLCRHNWCFSRLLEFKDQQWHIFFSRLHNVSYHILKTLIALDSQCSYHYPPKIRG